MDEHGDDADADYLLAIHATTRIVRQCEAHTRSAVEKLNSRAKAAARSSPHGADRERARRDEHRTAFVRRLDDVENASNALAMHLLGLVSCFQSWGP